MAHYQWRETAPVDLVWGAQEKRPVKSLHPQPQLFVIQRQDTKTEGKKDRSQSYVLFELITLSMGHSK